MSRLGNPIWAGSAPKWSEALHVSTLTQKVAAAIEALDRGGSDWRWSVQMASTWGSLS